MANNQNEKPGNTQGALILGLYAPLFITIGYEWWFRTFSINDIWSILDIGVSVCVVLPLLGGLIFKRNGRQILANIGTCVLGGSVLSALLLLMGASVLLRDYTRVPALEQFVSQDFAWVDHDNTGKVTNKQLQAIVNADSSVRSKISDLEYVQRQIERTFHDPLGTANVHQEIDKAFQDDDAGRAAAHNAVNALVPSDAAVTAAKQPMADAITALQDRLVDQERIDRIAWTDDEMCTVGTKTTEADGTVICAATRQDLLNLRAAIERQYPTWIWLLRKATLIQ